MSKEFLHNTAYSVQLPYIAGLSLEYKFLQNKMLLKNGRGEFSYNSFQLVRLDVLRLVIELVMRYIVRQKKTMFRS